MMKSLLALVGLAGMVVMTTGCGAGALGAYPFGAIYNDTQTPHGATRLEAAGQQKSGDKSGEACATSILSLVAWGDASLDSAKKAGTITDVHSIEFKNYSILGVYNKGCTVAHGR